MKKILSTLLLTILLVTLVACGAKEEDLKTTRDLKWEGDELTVSLGTNKTSGCEWKAKFEDDSIIDYSIHSVFHLKSETGKAAGISDQGFKGKSAGTTKIYLTTPVDWDGNSPGYAYVVTVTVEEDGTITNATGEEMEAGYEVPTEAPVLSDEELITQTFDTYFETAFTKEMIENILKNAILGEESTDEEYDFSIIVDAYMGRLHYNIDKVVVDGDNAKATVTIYMPDMSEEFFTEMNKEFEPAIAEKFDLSKPESVDRKEYLQFSLDFMGNYMKNNDTKEITNTDDVILAKKDGHWTVEE